MLETVLHHPRKLWVRRALFQVHLWAGIVLALYAVIISMSGAILVFQDEIRLASLRRADFDETHVAAISSVIAQAKARFPTQTLTFVGVPHEENPWWTLYLSDAKGKPDLAYADAATGMPLVQHGRLFIDWVLDLHVYLLAGRTGFVVNCIAGIGLLLLAVTGAILWWPGIRLWKRALAVSMRRGWKRVNYDLHSAIGIWTLGIVSWWGITAIYFLMPQQVSAVVNAISPLVGMKPPAASKATPSTAIASIDAMVANVPAIAPGSLSGVALPEKPGGAITLYVGRLRAGDFSHRDIVTLDGHTGKPLGVWHYGNNRSLGDWFLWLMYPLHFGTLWGMGVKILWCLLGLSVSVLSVTGVLMYWNRKLSKLFIRSCPPRVSQ
jgi:uncharacterized iron-regulated membrane protein